MHQLQQGSKRGCVYSETVLSFIKPENYLNQSSIIKLTDFVVNLAENDNIQVKKTGTTTLGLVCKDGVVLAADKKATFGNLIASKETEKIFALDDNIAMTIAGLSGDCQALVRYRKQKKNFCERCCHAPFKHIA
jgi:hypothetical protein